MLLPFLQNLIDKWRNKPELMPPPTLCTIHFIYDTKGIIGAGKNKKDSALAWIEYAATKKDCLKLFNPPGVDIKHCVVTEIIIVPIETVKHAAE